MIKERRGKNAIRENLNSSWSIFNIDNGAQFSLKTENKIIFTFPIIGIVLMIFGFMLFILPNAYASNNTGSIESLADPVDWR